MKSNIELTFSLSHQFLSNFVITPIINIGIKQKENQKKRYLVEIYPDNIKELKNSSTPYGSQID